MSETRIVQLNAEDRTTVLRLQKLREDREARFQDLLRRYCEAVYVRVPERMRLSVTPEGNISISD
jgi:hypothetical protein